jgi:hypothetical protein
MEFNPESSETTRLLSELDLAIEQLSAMREIVTRYEKLHRLESITGPSNRTRVMREEIEKLERRLEGVRKTQRIGNDTVSAAG